MPVIHMMGYGRVASILHLKKCELPDMNKEAVSGT